ncbi:GNAT family N-acetyltransferase [bacterium]|nr:GNAT family N-acetyltransferase [bacterium]
MNIQLRKLNDLDVGSFISWMNDESVLSLATGTSENFLESDLRKCFSKMINSSKDFHYAITLNDRAIGFASLIEDRYGGHKMQLMIGDKDCWAKGYDMEAVRQLVEKARELNNVKVYLEIRPESERSIAAFASYGFIPTKNKRYPKDGHFPRALKMELS